MAKNNGCFTFGVILFITNIVLGGIAVQYVVEFWGSYSKQVPVDIPFLPCVVAGLFFGEIAVPAAIITWLISFLL